MACGDQGCGLIIARPTITYRAVYTVKFEEAVYVLHCFQKKSKQGISTPKNELDLVESRLKVAEDKHREWVERKKSK